MTNRMTVEQVRDFWERQATEHGTSPSASWTDVRVIEMEIRELATRIADGDIVLDVGCANGFSTVTLALSREVDVTGIDYVPEMIQLAKQRLERQEADLRGHVSFEVGEVTDLAFDDGHFDKVISTRVIINLGEWDRQVSGLRECLRVLKAGGVLLLSEASLQGWERLNAMRAEWGLSEIPIPDFNNYIDENRLAADLSEIADLEQIIDFSSSYYVATRVAKPLLALIAETDVAVADPLAEWNRWASRLPPVGDYGTQKIFVLRKRGDGDG